MQLVQLVLQLGQVLRAYDGRFGPAPVVGERRVDEAQLREALDQLSATLDRLSGGGSSGTKIVRSLLQRLPELSPAGRRSLIDSLQATLAELTARTIADSVRRFAAATNELYVCGGGAHNKDLLTRLARNLPGTSIETTAAVGLDQAFAAAPVLAAAAVVAAGLASLHFAA